MRRKNVNRRTGLLLAVLIATLGYSCIQQKEVPLPILGPRDLAGTDTLYHTIGEFSFINQDSSFVTHETFKDKIYVSDFFFTSCRTICPIMKTQMVRVYEAMKDDPDVLILSHTIDPKHDTVALLHDYAERLGVRSDKWHFVTGDQDAIFDIAQKSYFTTALEDAAEPDGFIHSGAFLLIDKARRIRGKYDGTQPEEVDELIRDIQRLKAEYDQQRE